MPRITAVLVSPKTPGNIGAVARCLANFDGEELVLVSPRCDVTTRSYSRARGGERFLDDRREVSSLDALDSYQALIATTGILGGPGNLRRTPVMSDSIGEVMPSGDDARVGLVFGREDLGLDNDEIEACDHVVHIPACESYPVLNLSHAACVVLYEAYRSVSDNEGSVRHPERSEKEAFLSVFEDVVGEVSDASMTNEDEIWLAMKRVLVRSDVTQAEFGALFKFLRHVDDQL